MIPESSTEEFERRNEIEEARAPEVLRKFRELQDAIRDTATLSERFRREIFTMASIGGGCRHCQAHGGYGLARIGVDASRITDLWDFENSTVFSDAEKSAFRFALAAGVVPNAVTPAHHAALREHFSNREISEILIQIAMAGWLNRWNDSLATVTDQEAADWAASHLAVVGWELGRHAGAKSEQRPGTPDQMRAADEAKQGLGEG